MPPGCRKPPWLSRTSGPDWNPVSDPEPNPKLPPELYLSRRPELAASRKTSTTHNQTRNYWCTGKDSNLRSPKGRQIYSLLPLTTRPPVPIFLTHPQIPVLAHPVPSGNF